MKDFFPRVFPYEHGGVLWGGRWKNEEVVKMLENYGFGDVVLQREVFPGNQPMKYGITRSLKKIDICN